KWLCKIICVIASDSEAIPTPCDCFVSLRSTRNDKYTINFTQALMHLICILLATNYAVSDQGGRITI
ncbi:MAG: hypothetical protein AAF757_25290, partial [Cyanobacteria bacterium P01_D01_bin.116]